MKHLLTKILPIMAITLAAIMVFAAIPAWAAAKDDICAGVAITGTGCDTSSANNSINNTVGLAINILSLIVGVVAVVMIIIGGLKYIMSSGDSTSINSAKNTILYAIIGLVIVALAQVIVKFVLKRVG